MNSKLSDTEKKNAQVIWKIEQKKSSDQNRQKEKKITRKQFNRSV